MNLIHRLPAIVDGQPTEVACRYEPSMPWSVRLVIRHNPVVVRHISRDLLWDGLWKTWDGEGIRVYSDEEWYTLQLAATTPDGVMELTVQFDRLPLEEALRDIYRLVPNQQETANMDWFRGMRALGEAA